MNSARFIKSAFSGCYGLMAQGKCGKMEQRVAGRNIFSDKSVYGQLSGVLLPAIYCRRSVQGQSAVPGR